MPGKHNAGGCGCCGGPPPCDCTFDLVDCELTWDCPLAFKTILYKSCATVWTKTKQATTTGTVTVQADYEYKLELYCEDTETPTITYDLGVLVTSGEHPECDSDCIPQPDIGACECVEDAYTKRSIAVADVTVSMASGATCTSCSTSITGHDWSGTYTVPCVSSGFSVAYYKATLIQTNCSGGGNDHYVIERLAISYQVDSDSPGYISMDVSIGAWLYQPATGLGNPCPTVTTTYCTAIDSSLGLNGCQWTGIDYDAVDWNACLNFDTCGNSSTVLRKGCVSTLTLTKSCTSAPPFFVTLCNYNAIVTVGSVVI